MVQDRTNAVQRYIVWKKNIHQRVSKPVRQAADGEPVPCDTVIKIVIIQLIVTSPPTCPDCGSQWVRSAPRFVVDGELSHLSTAEAADVYYEDREQYDDTSVNVFDCGNIVPTEETTSPGDNQD